MRARVYRFDQAEPRSSQPRYEIRTCTYGPGDSEIEIRPVFEADDFGDALTPELRAQEERVMADAKRNARA